MFQAIKGYETSKVSASTFYSAKFFNHPVAEKKIFYSFLRIFQKFYQYTLRGF